MIILVLVFTVVGFKLAEYRLWKNYGQVIYDYSKNGRHSVNGLTKGIDLYDCQYSDRGLYFYDYDSGMKMPNNDYSTSYDDLPVPYTVILWFKSFENSGRIFFRYFNSDCFWIARIEESGTPGQPYISIQTHSGSMQSTVNIQSNLYSDQWSLLSIELSANKVYIHLNSNTVLSLSFSNAFSELKQVSYAGAGIDIINEKSFVGLIWYVVIISSESYTSFIDMNGSNNCFNSGSCTCNVALIIDSELGCVSNINEFSLNADGNYCSASNCQGGLLKDCSCSSLSCTYDPKTVCTCPNTLQSLPSCICPDEKSCCNPGCSSCIVPNLCSVCIDSNSHVENNLYCKCNSGYYNSSQVIASGSCLPCIKRCISCSNSFSCDLCNANSYNFNGNCICKKGFYENFNSDCDPCPTECISCTLKESCGGCVDVFNCECQVGKWRNGNLASCDACIENCKVCNDGSTCLECDLGFYLDDLLGCGLCPPSCSACWRNGFGVVECVACVAGFGILDKECVPKCLVENECSCDDGMFFNKTTGICEECIENCRFCENKSYCVECYERFYLTNNLKCKECPRNCLNCTIIEKSVKAKCLNCISEYKLQNDRCVLIVNDESLNYFYLKVNIDNQNKLILYFSESPIYFNK